MFLLLGCSHGFFHLRERLSWKTGAGRGGHPADSSNAEGVEQTLPEVSLASEALRPSHVMVAEFSGSTHTNLRQ